MSEIPKIHVVAAVVVRGDGKILCARRGNAKNPCVAWKWEFPGGKIEVGETPESALTREIREEMNFPVVVGKHIARVNHSYPSCEIEMDAFFCVPAAACSMPELHEHVEIRWLAPEELPALDWAEADKPVVCACTKKLSGSA